ncbi:LOW QUALITY PROTEIN: disease resistance protein RUN1 [Eucalyptus grandis]|uniref:LOW QUALITY PROTEIN: disease resistance protein RUN1 n=1 Tax=Eucalyptus grandis TaxID=71139 RepID=UPI00192F0526|nr:LOW QUALITY PROTEIN: disease resistance protein RUN1 [Eucalyptus grandis]
MASSKKNYHVFVSFRGTDVRNNFLHDLYAALNHKGIYTFVDSVELRKGEQISPALMRAIEESRLAIIIFSKDYDSSRWCLEELAKIMECKAQKELIVLLVFYKVEPREVRRAIKGYGRAMAKHESDSEKDPKAVETWKKALFDAGNLSGWVCNDGDEAELIQSIVKELPIHLERTPLHVAEYLVGIDSRVEELISLSQKESDGDDVLMIGIWGPGGIGKTTIAKATYNAIERHFQGSIFLERVRETSNKCSLVELQKRLLSQILPPKHPSVHSVAEGVSLIKERLYCKKVLLVLDDVDHSCQPNALAGGGNWFGKGSRIFITTRDKHLVTSSHCMNRVYPVKTLDSHEALDLFVWHAFQNSKKTEIRTDLIYRALRCASGLPLALEALGSFLRGRNEPAWESELCKLSKSPDRVINQVLKISFDGLENDEKEIFLDIACFFKRKSIKYIKKVLNSCGFETTIGIETLIDRSLIRKEHGTLQMHDLVQLMGKNIVMQDYPKNPGRHSRLWLFEDVMDILCEDKVKVVYVNIVISHFHVTLIWSVYYKSQWKFCMTTEFAQLRTGNGSNRGHGVDLLTPEEGTLSLEEITIKADAFEKMTNLRMLILPEVHISSEGPIRLPSNLRWLKWPNAPFLEFGFGPKKLVGLDIQKSHIRQFDGKFKNFIWLKYINFSQCKSLVSAPELSSIPNLERLNLDGCESLVEVHQSVTCHNKLKFLSLQFCSNLSNFPHTLKGKISSNPRSLWLLMEHLEELDLGWTAIKELPASVENLLYVKIINLAKCKRLPTLPSSVYKLQNLKNLNLGGCSNFVMFPKNLEDSTNPNGNSGFQKLKWLDLNGCNLSEVEFLESPSCFPKLGGLSLSGNKLTHLPTCIDKYDDLEHLDVHNCKQLQKIPQLPPNVHVLWANGCRSLREFLDLSSLSSSCRVVELYSCRELFREGANTANLLSLKELPKMRIVSIILSGREMPEWFLRCKDNSISFMVPGDLNDKFLGVALCIVLGLKEGKAADVRCDIHMGGQGFHGVRRRFPLMKSDTVWIEYFSRSTFLLGEKLPPDDQSHFQVHLNVLGGKLIKWGFRAINEQEEDDLKILPQHHQPNETNQSLEERKSEEDIWFGTEEDESSSETDDECNKEKLSQPNETNWSSEERDSEEDKWIDTEEEESSSETEDEYYREMLFKYVRDCYCSTAESACRSFNSRKKLTFGSFSGLNKFRRSIYSKERYR